MSHFTVGVMLPAIDIENEAAIASAIERAMMPYHEFECTGINEYIQDIDETEEYIEKYLNETHEVVRLADGTCKGKYDCSFSRPANEEEVKAIELYEASGDHFNRKNELLPGFSYSTSYSGDKKSYTRNCAYPDDSEIVNIPYYEHQSFYEFIKDQISDEFNLIPLNDDPDIEEADKFGYIRLIGEERDTTDMSKEDLKKYIKETYQVINRTNPDRWSWVDNEGQEIAITYGEESVPFLQENVSCRGEFLLDDSRRLVYLLQGLYTAEQQGETNYTSAAQMASEGDVRDISRGVQQDDEGTEGMLQNLREEVGTSNWRICDRPFTSNGGGQSSSLSQLQHNSWKCEGRHIYLRPAQRVSTPIRKCFISGKQWDWYQVGGRWTGMIRKKDGTTADICKIADIDFEPDQSQYNKSLRFWEIVVEDSPLLPGEKEPFNFYKKEYLLDRYKTKESYALEQASFGTFALIDLDGKWHECGSMGWFGYSDDTKESADEFKNLFNRRLLNADGDCIFAVVDCHI